MNRLTLLSIGRAATCTGTMVFAGAIPVLRHDWDMAASTAGAIQTAFNLANALALLGSAWLADSFGAKRIYLACSWTGALSMVLFALFARSPDSALVLIALVGLTQGGCYSTALILAAELSPPERRGRAIGQILAAGSFGYLISVFTSLSATSAYGAQVGFGLCALGTIVGAVVNKIALSGSASETPKPVIETAPRQPLDWSYLVGPASLCLLIAYIAHCWELLGYWAWTPTLLVASLHNYQLSAVSSGLVVACVIHFSGMVATALIGRASDIWPRHLVLVVVAGAGAMCSALIGWSTALGGLWTLGLAAMGSFFILGDSGVLSAAMTEAVPRRYLGRIMGLRSLLGFGAGAVAPTAFGVAYDATHQWGWAFMTLAVGGAIACMASIWLGRLEATSTVACGLSGSSSK